MKERLERSFKIAWLTATIAFIMFVVGIIGFTWQTNDAVHYISLTLVILSLLALPVSFFIAKFGKQQ
ncbi:MAG: hypothetical protein LBP70_03855 [Mycoplasmataceae bacterium]|jgi:hypothetical protein|nr:hypothetical protein [Mycoplasmataceae bacterium]